ncbi:spore photoproduct lyase [Desulfofundulus sp.]|uniref:spore photoproduct lyase n=1 Tax=Desulfofundulus sp. TaxID=2282750 RepID=UPI003C73CB14
MDFYPDRVIFEQDALKYPLGKSLWESFKRSDIEVIVTLSHNRITGIPGKNPQEAYREAKKTLVFGVRRTLTFQTCKPSAHYQLPLTTSCPGKCEYCYLLGSLPSKPYIRAYINIEEILEKARDYIVQRQPEVTVFEGSATSDPVPVEKYTGALAKTILFFAVQDFGRFRFATKFTEIESLLMLKHNGHTTIRFSVNTTRIITSFEHGTPKLEQRLKAARKVIEAGYPTGFIIAPIIAYPGWETDYIDLLKAIRESLPDSQVLSFEFITHRFTVRAKNRIKMLFPNTVLPLNGENRKFKFGQFGYGKYVYAPQLMQRLKETLVSKTEELFPGTKIDYFV